MSVDSDFPLHLAAFWKRQADANPTAKQNSFDLSVGVLLPIFCLSLFPLVVRGFTGGSTGPYPIAGIVAIGLSMVALGLWLCVKSGAAFQAGILAASAGLALTIGIVLLPLSVIGCFYGIGVLGFSPFATAFAYGRNTIRAWRLARRQMSQTRAFAAAFLGCLVYVGLASGAHWYVTREVQRALAMLKSQDSTTSQNGEQDLRRFSWFADANEIVYIYDTEQSPARKQRFAKLFRDMSGEDIERRLKILDD